MSDLDAGPICGSCAAGAHDLCDAALSSRKDFSGNYVQHITPGSGSASNPMGEETATYQKTRKIPCTCESGSHPLRSAP